MRRSLLIALALTLGAGSRLAAVDPAVCTPPSDAQRTDFIIDAATGGSQGSTRYKLSNEVRIVIINKNPYAFDYKTTVTDEQIAEKGLTDFLKAFSFTSAIIPAAPPATAASGTPSSTAAPRGAPLAREAEDLCSDALAREDQARNLSQRNKDLATATQNTANLYKAAETLYQNALEALKDPRRRMGANAVCSQIVSAANEFIQKVDTLQSGLSLDPVATGAANLERQAEVQEALVSDFMVAVIGECTLPEAKEAAKPWRDQIEASRKTATTVTTKLKEIREGLGELVKQRSEVEVKASQPGAFYEIHTRGPFDDLTNVKIELQSKPVRVEGSTFAKVGQGTWTLNFGGRPRFTTSAGIAYSHMEDRTFKRVTGIPRPDRNSPPPASGTLGNVIGLDKDSEWRAVPLVLLNARLWEPGMAALEAIHLSFGLSAKIENSSANAEYLAGLSLSFARERLFLTVGGYYGGVNELSGDLFVGATVPESLNDIPTRKEKHWKPGFALSYRLNP